MNKEFFNPEPRLLAHRGMPLEFPENTYISFKNAVEFGIDVIETDTHLTKDNQFIILHDAEISRVSNGTGVIADYTLKELMEFDAGYNFTQDNGKTFPFRGKGITFISVAELLEKFPNQRFNIDLKDNYPVQIKYWAELIKEYDAEYRVLTASQFTKNLQEVRKIFPDMATSFSAREVFNFYLANKFGGYKKLLKKKFSGDALQVPVKMAGLRIVSEKSIENAHKLGFKMHVWTINTAKEMKQLFDMKVDAIFTDNPRMLKSLLEVSHISE
ncbi:MAG: glycerophosphodiester phosphodiesterase [Promethearchaeota archaeon]